MVSKEVKQTCTVRCCRCDCCMELIGVALLVVDVEGVGVAADT